MPPRPLSALLFAALAALALPVRADPQEVRDARAQERLNKSTAELKAENDEGAALDLLACVNEAPSEKILVNCYRNLGVVEVRLGHLREGRNWFAEYLPHCSGDKDCDGVKKIVRKYSEATDGAERFIDAQVVEFSAAACKLTINKGTSAQVKQNAIVSVFRGNTMIDTGVVESAQATTAKIRLSNLHSCDDSTRFSSVKVAAL
jgi:hypothetical protein